MTKKARAVQSAKGRPGASAPVGMRSSEDDPATRLAVYRYSGRRWVPVDGPPVAGSDALTAVDALPDGTVLGVGTKDVEAGRRTRAITGSTCPAR